MLLGTPSRCTGAANKEAVSEGLQQDALAGERQLGAKWGTGLDSTCQVQCRRGEGGCGTLRCLPARISFRTWGVFWPPEDGYRTSQLPLGTGYPWAK